MVDSKLCIATVLLSLHAANSYILLTANIEDVHAIAKQIANSPVASQITKIIRHASSIFNQQYNKQADVASSPKIQLRTDPTKDQAAVAANVAPANADTADDDGEGEGDNFEVWKPKLKDANLPARASSESDPSDVSAESNDINPEPENRHSLKRKLEVGPDLIERRHNQGSDQKEEKHLEPDLVELGKNASFYLTSIKKIFEDV